MLTTAIYIHTPWCIKKCPYCDFNSHKADDTLPEQAYIDALIEDFDGDLHDFPAGVIKTIFIGGGTPSLLQADAYQRLFQALQARVSFAKDIEITMEANPGTVEQSRFDAYRNLGINRLSLGIQSFNDEHLKKLGRIHGASEAHRAIDMARLAGFDNMNIDIMHGLPNQTPAQGLDDLKAAIKHQPEHLSWYQLTLEPNTVFYKQKPILPSEQDLGLLEEQGFDLLGEHGYQRYEISAFSKPLKQSKHNLNYWQYGCYYGIGAGAHGLHRKNGVPMRTRKHRLPSQYLDKSKPYEVARDIVQEDELMFEFMINASRLEGAQPIGLFHQQTKHATSLFLNRLDVGVKKGLVGINGDLWYVTRLGRRFTNDLQTLFLP